VTERGVHIAPVGTSIVPNVSCRVLTPGRQQQPGVGAAESRRAPATASIASARSTALADELDREDVLARPDERLLRRARVLLLEQLELALALVDDRVRRQYSCSGVQPNFSTRRGSSLPHGPLPIVAMNASRCSALGKAFTQSSSSVQPMNTGRKSPSPRTARSQRALKKFAPLAVDSMMM
jgi:hypothetical protein